MAWTKMTERTPLPAQARPHAVYKKELLDRLRALSPASILDVGCGDGILLRSACEAGCVRCVGLEPDEQAAGSAQAAGLEVHVGRAENLPFPDRSFDIVAFEYVTHHLEHLQKSLLEAARVADRAVLVLDCWYDEAFASQQVARDYDEWSKRIDRRTGMVHNPCPAPPELAAPFMALGGFEIDLSCRLVLRPVPIETMAVDAREQLSLVDDDPELRRELGEILDRARRHGATDDGAILMTAERRGVD